MNGRLRLAGITEAGDLGELLDLIHALFVDSPPQLQHGAELLDQPFWNERAEWGRTSAAQRGHAAMMALAGGPAPMRDPDAQRPARRPAEQTEG